MVILKKNINFIHMFRIIYYNFGAIFEALCHLQAIWEGGAYGYIQGDYTRSITVRYSARFYCFIGSLKGIRSIDGATLEEEGKSGDGRKEDADRLTCGRTVEADPGGEEWGPIPTRNRERGAREE